MDREKIYTSTSNKLLEDLFRLQMVQKNIWHPINLQLSPTNKCNLNCEFCSVKDRKNDELTLFECQQIIDKFVALGIKSIEITGGGDPTCYPYINQLIEYCYKKGLSIGLITNGVLLKKTILQKNLDRLIWLRISLNSFDQGTNDIDVPKIKGTLGFSYVWNDKSHSHILDKIYNYAIKYNSEYVRVVPDCLKSIEQKQLLNQVKKLIYKKGFEDKIFIQQKSYEVYPECYIGRLKPYVYSDGYVYQCSAAALYNRDFGKQWQLCHWTKINKLWRNNFKPFDNSMCKKGKCFYHDQNKLLSELQMRSKHHGFI